MPDDKLGCHIALCGFKLMQPQVPEDQSLFCNLPRNHKGQHAWQGEWQQVCQCGHNPMIPSGAHIEGCVALKDRTLSMMEVHPKLIQLRRERERHRTHVQRYVAWVNTQNEYLNRLLKTAKKSAK